MEPILKHTWELSEADAIKLQQELSLKVIKEDHFAEINYGCRSRRSVQQKG